jgi:hypothetical protein
MWRNGHLSRNLQQSGFLFAFSEVLWLVENRVCKKHVKRYSVMLRIPLRRN